MAAHCAVEALDVIEYVAPCVVPRTVDLAARPLRFQRREEARHRLIASHVADSAHRALDAMVSYEPLKLIASVLAAAIRMMQQRVCDAL